MKRSSQFGYLTGLGILNLFLFASVFTLLQQETVYEYTLGAVSSNYERTGGWDDYEINRVSKPFLNVKNEKYTRWDAAIYECISERMYMEEEACYGRVRAAFFPLFPLLWKASGTTPLGISLINYLLFVVSLAALTTYFLNIPFFHKLIVFTILVSLPSTIIYYIPYTEALFLLTMTIAAFGMLKQKYALFFAGAVLMTMVRPAAAFVLIAFLLAEGVVFLQNKSIRASLKRVFFKGLPFGIGLLAAITIQYGSSGSWTALFDAQAHWDRQLQPVKSITDWSVEGFGLNAFAVFFASLPAVLFLTYLFTFMAAPLPGQYLSRLKENGREYLFLVAVFYLSSLFVFTLLTTGGNFHGFFRFTLATPLFYIALLLLTNYAFDKPKQLLAGLYLVPVILLIVFLNSVEYGGDRLRFPFFGLYIYMATGLFLLAGLTMSRPLQIGITSVILLLNTVWNAYLLNIFLSNGWIFT